ncbi:hypothetical protein AAFC00_004247 [Neodothiora populina]|uniref:Uncharacterized protein n=1 Tax=Neodothiora populina TaxID=2781224 RepID=A0ABR3PJ19_9PEZI
MYTEKKGSAQQAQQQQQQQQQQQSQYTRPQPKGAFGASPQKPRPAPPPRNDTRLPTEEEIRAGMNYRPAPGASSSSDRAPPSWADFQQQNAGKPGMGRSNTTKTPKRGGFNPMSGGDEGQAGSTANYSTRARTKSDDTRAFPPPPPPPARDPEPTPESHSYSNDAPYTEGSRVRTPYSFHPGQKRFTSSDNLRQSTPTRESAARTSTSRANGSAQKPVIIDSDSDDNSSSATDSTATTPENANAQTKPSTPSAPNPFAPRPRRTPVPPSSRTASPFKTSRFESASPGNLAGNKPHAGATDGAGAGHKATFTGSAANGQPAEQGRNTIFTFPIDASTFGTPGVNSTATSKGDGPINTDFTPGLWEGKFSAPNVFAAPVPARKPSSPTRKSSRIFRTQANGSATSESNGGGFAAYSGSTNTEPPPPAPSPPQNPVKFSADEWAKTMSNPSWILQPEPSRSSSTAPTSSRPSSRGNRKASAKTSAVKIPATMPKPANVTPVEDESTNDREAQTTKTAPAQPQASQPVPAEDAMDIDMGGISPAPSTTFDFTASASQKKEPKFVQVDPSNLRKSASLGEVNSSNTGLRTKLDDLADVLSQSTTGSGLADLADVASTLPFQSKPSTTLPTKSYAPQLLVLPKLPIAPEAPVKLTKQSWQRYCEVFSRYMTRFHDFDGTIVGHFDKRRVEAREMLLRGAAELESVGALKWLDYKKSVEEDERVRAHWSIGHEKHLDAVRGFEAVRERVRKLSEGTGLADF